MIIAGYNRLNNSGTPGGWKGQRSADGYRTETGPIFGGRHDDVAPAASSGTLDRRRIVAASSYYLPT